MDIDDRRPGGGLIRRARRRAGLTQVELARRLGTDQAVVARWEGGRRSPTFETIERAAAVCGQAVSVRLIPAAPTGIDRSAIARLLSLTPEERLELAGTEGSNLLAFDEAIGR